MIFNDLFFKILKNTISEFGYSDLLLELNKIFIHKKSPAFLQGLSNINSRLFSSF
ncbi:hypothetical protein DFQ04_2179 [Algoriphagus boseongensis]|uniref:Uncharacterized protein n=1 Tax=Algoriphagus boseongensis TaxID=1442587 RepID=A0A4R6T8D5_9BACT|nr:hypothetical protein DFQ04_2179 [Algoriphagus boseongensis]